MMDDRQIIELLRDQRTNTPGLDPARVIVGAKRRRARSRMAVGLASAAAVAAALSGVAAGALSGQSDGGGTMPDSQPPVASEHVPSGAFEPIQVSRAEVGRRCSTVFGNEVGQSETVIVPPHTEGPWYEGRTAWVASVGDSSFQYSCEIPQAGMVDAAGTVPTSLPDADDSAGIRAACGRFLGWDFTGWEVVTAASSDVSVAALLRSTNGYRATCTLDAAPGHQEDGSYVRIQPWSAPVHDDPDDRDYAIWLGIDHYAENNQMGDYSIFDIDRLRGPREAVQVVLTEPDGTEHTSDVIDGWYAIAEDLTLEMQPNGVTPLRITVLAANGTVLADYMDGEQTMTTGSGHDEPAA